jgi:hypothetical protein
MVKTKFGYLHVHYGPDMDGANRTFEWVGSEPQSFGLLDEDAASYAAEYGEEVAGWFAMCEVEPDAGWVGPFETEKEAVRVATDEDALHAWEVSSMGDDPMGDWHGRNV